MDGETAITPVPMPKTGEETVSVKAGEKGIFGEIAFTEAGTYTYKITETAGSTVGMTYDEDEKSVVVAVTDANKDGVLEAAIKYDGNKDALEVENKYELGSLKVTKAVTVDGEKTTDATFTGKSYYVSVKSGDDYYATNGAVVTGDDRWVEIKDGQTRTWENLPAGSYTVEEKTADAEVTGYELTPTVATNPVTVAVGENAQAAKVTVTNAYVTRKTETQR